MNYNSIRTQRILTNEPLESNGDYYVKPGVQTYAVGASSFRVNDLYGFTFALVSEFTCELAVDISWVDPTGGGPPIGWHNLFTIAVPAATVFTHYDLAAPMGAHGRVTFAAEFMRINIADTAISDHGYTRFAANFWSP